MKYLWPPTLSWSTYFTMINSKRNLLRVFGLKVAWIQREDHFKFQIDWTYFCREKKTWPFNNLKFKKNLILKFKIFKFLKKVKFFFVSFFSLYFFYQKFFLTYFFYQKFFFNFFFTKNFFHFIFFYQKFFLCIFLQNFFLTKKFFPLIFFTINFLSIYFWPKIFFCQ